jgi:hypothetical protein
MVTADFVDACQAMRLNARNKNQHMKTNVHVEQLLWVLGRSPIEEIYVTGYIDSGTGPCSSLLPFSTCRQFHPIWDDVYLCLGEQLLRLSTSDRDPRLRLLYASRIECSFEIDPDDTFGVMGMLRTVLQSGHDSARILEVELFVDSDCDPEHCIVAAAGLVTSESDYLFFDPLTFEGIHVGGRRSRDLWVDHFGSRYRSIVKSTAFASRL